MDVRKNLFFFDNGCSYPYLKKRRRIPRKDLPPALQEFRSSPDDISADKTNTHIKEHLQALSILRLHRKKQNVDFLHTDSGVKVKKNEKQKRGKKSHLRAGNSSEFYFDCDGEDDGKFLFEESKYSATSILAQLGKLLQVIWERILYESDRWDSALHESPELELKKNINGFIWKFLLTDNFKKNVFILPDHIVKLVSVEYKDFVRNINHKPREWQTQAYRDVINFSDGALKRTDSGIFSIPLTRMSDFTCNTVDSKSDKHENALNAKSSKDSGMTSENDGPALLAYRRESRTPVHYLPTPAARHVRICIGKGSPRIAESSNQKINHLKNGRIEDAIDEGLLQSQQETISFSLSSKNFHEKGWVMNPSSFGEHEEKAMYAWIRARLQQAMKKREQEELANAHNYIYDDVVVHYYGDAKLRRSQKNRPRYFRRTENERTPFMITLRDGSFTIFYPSGNVAVLNSLSKGSRTSGYTLVYGDKNEDNRILAHFVPSGRGVCYHKNGQISFISTSKSACCHDELGGLITKWKWTSQKLVPSFNLQLSSCMTFRCSLKENMILFVNIDGESTKVPLGAPESIEEKGTDKSKKCLTTKVKKEDKRTRLLENANKPTKKAHSNILSYQMELAALHKNFKVTVNKWMDHYRIAVGMKASHQPAIKRNSMLSRSASHLRHSRKSPTMVKERAPSAPPGFRKSSVGGTRSSSSLGSKHYSLESDDSAICLASPTKLPFRCGVLQPQGAALPRKGCPVVLRLDMMGIKDSHCRCDRKKIPIITDIEFDEFIASLPKSQLVVVSITKERCSNPFDSTLNQIQYDTNKNRSFPCVQASCDPFRLFRYPIPSKEDEEDASLLIVRHKAVAGMFILYLGGKLLCADYMFDGYGYSKKDFLNHISRARQKALEDKYLPNDFRFSPTDGRSSPTKLLPEKESGETIESYNIVSNVTSTSDDVDSQILRDTSRTSDEVGSVGQGKSSPQLNVRFIENSLNRLDIKSQ